MDKKKKLATVALAAMVSTGVVSTQAVAKGCDVEKCYGIAKAGSNDCGGKGTGHACQGSSTSHGSQSDWMYVMKGTCSKIVGGSTKPGGSDK